MAKRTRRTDKDEKAPRAKAIAFSLIAPSSDVGRPMYAKLNLLVDRYHEEIADARIALAWCTSWKPDRSGRVILGKCRRASDLDRELAPYDFVILLSKPFWLDPHVSDAQRLALLDHELMHASIVLDKHGEPKRDERNRPIYGIRKHDIEEFADIVSRHGLYKADLEQFAGAIDRARFGATWPGYTSVREQLAAAGQVVALQTVIGWTEAERREAEVWARLKGEIERLGVTTVEFPPPPAFVATAALALAHSLESAPAPSPAGA